jgi:type VI secretion system protein ImpF
MPGDVYLPSLLDRLADDSYVSGMIGNCQREIDLLLKKLSNQGGNDTDETRQQWLQTLKQQQNQLTYLKSVVGSLQNIKDCVKRDLGWLLNSHNLCLDGLDDMHPETAKSVLNYGMPDLAGKTASSLQTGRLEKMLEKTILVFEPRILKNSLRVRLLSDESMFDHNALVFEITGQLWAEPVPLHLQLTTQLDLESGDIKILE